MLKGIIGPLQLAIHVLQNRHDREQEKHWERTKLIKEITVLKDVSFLFVLSQWVPCCPTWWFCTM